MESNPTTAATIAELWREFQKTLKHKPAMYISHAAHKGIEVTRYAKHISEAATKYTALRAQLIERCVLEYGLKIHSEADGSAWIYETWISPTRICGINDTRNRAASLNFMAWELEQRQRESTATAETTQQQP